MFVQIIQGAVADADLLKRRMELWKAEVKPDAAGHLGSTGGITSDGTFIMTLRYLDEAAAHADAARAEQRSWWNDTVAAFTGEPSSVGTSEVDVFMEGSDDAGFVQMMRASVADRARFRALDAEIGPLFVEQRPDVLGHIAIWLPGDVVHIVDWFTSEAEARAGESKEFPDDLKKGFGEWMGQLSDVRWFDLPDPMLDSA